MTNTDLASLLLIWLVDVVLVIYMIASCCYYQLHQLQQRRHRREDDDVDGDRPQQEAAAQPHAQPVPASAVQMTAIAVVALLDHITYPRQNSDDVGDSDGNDDHLSAAVVTTEECAICLGKFEDGDWCSVMPVCSHEFHRSCIAKWLTVCNNTCPLCRAQLQWDIVAHDMV